MPTENRSSNTEMVSVPRELTPEMREAFHASYEDYEDGRGECPDSQWRAMLHAAPQRAQQPHPEPIAWMVGTAFWWTKEEAERDAAAMNLPVIGLGPMAGSADIDQLQLEIAKLQLDLTMHDAAAIQDECIRAENSELRARLDERDAALDCITTTATSYKSELAERDALLGEALEFIDDGVGRSDTEWQLIKKMRAALSPEGAASAIDEPYQGMPGTSFQRLNALANQGE